MKQNWTYKKLGEICEIYQPKTISTEMLCSDGEFLVYGANGVIGRYNQYNHEESEVLMTCRGATCGTINISEPHSWINGNAMVIHPKTNDTFHSQSFLVYLLRSLDLSTIITGCAQPQITRMSLAPILIPVPPLSTQSRIVSELDLLQSLIDKQKAQLKELDTLAQSIFYEMFGDPVENEKGWEVKKLGEVACFKNGLNYSLNETGKKYYIIGVSDFHSKSEISCDSELSTIYTNDTIDNGYLLQDNDILFVRSNGNKQLIARNMLIKTNKLDVTFSGFCIRARIIDDAVSPLYVNFLLKLPSGHKALTMKGRGCNISNLNQTTLNDFPIILPSLSLQQSFAAKIESIENQKAAISQSIAETQKLFDYTMDKYFG